MHRFDSRNFTLNLMRCRSSLDGSWLFNVSLTDLDRIDIDRDCLSCTGNAISCRGSDSGNFDFFHLVHVASLFKF